MLAITGDDAGLLDLALHPQFAANGWIYAAYSAGDAERSTIAVDRFRVQSARIVDRDRLFVANAWSADRYHYGGRLAFLDGYLFVTIGDRHHQARAQDLRNHAGKIIRLHDDGRVPLDNPFAGGDELNVIRRGANYGWPDISYGWEYAGGPIGMGITQHDGMVQPS
jgi:glucose/arabinose dehydrogenase